VLYACHPSAFLFLGHLSNLQLLKFGDVKFVEGNVGMIFFPFVGDLCPMDKV
jgi:hypothetical protein